MGEDGGREGGGWREQGRDERGGNDRNNAQVLAQLHRGQSAPCWPANKQTSFLFLVYFLWFRAAEERLWLRMSSIMSS